MGENTGNMSTGSKHPRRLRVWPAIVWPLGATLLFFGGGYLFISKIAADQEQADAAVLRLESYARLECGDLVSRARTLAQSFVGNRLDQREKQEKNQHLMLRSVMDGVLRVLRAGLEKTRAVGSSLRDVGDFPTGFEGLRLYLELAGQPERASDPVLTTLRGCAPELGALLPSGCALSVVENNFEELLSLGGGAVPDKARTESMTREFIWGDGPSSRHWTLQVKLSEPDAHPYPDAREIAAYLGEQLGHLKLMDTAWRGWLVERSGVAAAAFPDQGGAAGSRRDDSPPFVTVSGEWVDSGNGKLAWMNRSESLSRLELVPAVAVSIARPAPPLVPADVFMKDLRWSSFLSAFALLSLGLWGWFARAMLSSDPPVAVSARERSSAKGASAAGRTAVRAALQQRLVHDGTARRGVPDAQDVIVADIDDAGEVHVEEVRVPSSPPKPKLVIPSGSLLRLQERHRGGKGRVGSRVLDQARSQVLRELASRVRPVVVMPVSEEAAGPRRPSGRVTEKINAMKAPGGWDKVG